MKTINWMRYGACLAVFVALPLGAATVRIIQTNSAGDNIHIIDPVTNKVVGIVKGIEVNHGAAVSPDGTRMYFSNEAEDTLDVVDYKTLQVTKRIKLTGRPNNIDISKDGKKVYVSIIQAPGSVDVVDTATLAVSKNIPVRKAATANSGGVHNTYVSPDGKYVISGSVVGRMLTVIDQATERIVWDLEMPTGVRPMTISKKADGSTDKIFMNLSELHGFAVIDFDQRKEVARVTLPDPEFGALALIAGTPSHGLAIGPDGKSIWCNSEITESVYGYTLPDLKPIGRVHVGVVPDWLSMTPDGKLYVANAGSETVQAIDIKTLKVIATIPVGSSPKRNITAIFP
jgi:YVTN family beta-propeller protein